VCPKDKDREIYLLGNPPYRGYSLQDEEQKDDLKAAASCKVEGYKKLDYISAWFIKGAEYIKSSSAKLSFVSTNSICQGQQVEILWPSILSQQIEISFAYTSFKWTNNAKRNAGVYVVILGLTNKNKKLNKYIYSGTRKIVVKNINPYLVSGENIFVRARSSSLSNIPQMVSGLKAGDDGNLILSKQEKSALFEKYPDCKKLIKRYIGAREFMDGIERYCIWVSKENAEFASSFPQIKERFDKCKNFRLKSKKKATQKKANTPYSFDETNWVNSNPILIPQTGSEKRNYLPVAFLDSEYVISNGARVIYDAEPWIFGLLSSRMHITWVKAVAGRLKMDMQYSNTLCYNTFPVQDLTEKQKEMLTTHVYTVLEEREKNSEKTMAEQYDPEKMPDGLREAHYNLDLAVERCYRSKPFQSDEERLEYLFKLYEEMTEQEENPCLI
jgi:hypothetical protein